jgi:hypothetical protein
MSEPRFRVGQVLMWQRSRQSRRRRDLPVVVLEVVTEVNGEVIEEPYYRVSRSQCLAEHMLRPLRAQEVSA